MIPGASPALLEWHTGNLCTLHLRQFVIPTRLPRFTHAHIYSLWLSKVSLKKKRMDDHVVIHLFFCIYIERLIFLCACVLSPFSRF